MNSHQGKPEPGVVINPPASLLGVRNAILRGKAKQHHIADFPGPLSIKSVVRGSAMWGTNEAERLVDVSNYLILNSGQSYSLTIDSRETVETFCLFFRCGDRRRRMPGGEHEFCIPAGQSHSRFGARERELSSLSRIL